MRSSKVPSETLLLEQSPSNTHPQYYPDCARRLGFDRVRTDNSNGCLGVRPTKCVCPILTKSIDGSRSSPASATRLLVGINAWPRSSSFTDCGWSSWSRLPNQSPRPRDSQEHTCACPVATCGESDCAHRTEES